MMRNTVCYLLSLIAYFAYGLVHELIHFCCAYFFGFPQEAFDPTLWKKVLLDMIFHRRLSFDIDNGGTSIEDFQALHEKTCYIIEQVGWLSSLLISVLIHMRLHHLLRRDKPSSDILAWITLAGYVTALDAICTDLLGMKQIPYWSSLHEETNDDSLRVVFYCGNFGLILLHGAWLNKNGGKSALDILEKMIECEQFCNSIIFIFELNGAKEVFLIHTTSSDNDARSPIW